MKDALQSPSKHVLVGCSGVCLDYQEVDVIPAPLASRGQPALSIQHLESCLGERVFVDMMGGRQPYLVAALKSLPLREDDEPANSSLAEREMVRYLIAECSGQLEGEPVSPASFPFQSVHIASLCFLTALTLLTHLF